MALIIFTALLVLIVVLVAIASGYRSGPAEDDMTDLNL
jgi:hypothetical protein